MDPQRPVPETMRFSGRILGEIAPRESSNGEDLLVQHMMTSNICQDGVRILPLTVNKMPPFRCARQTFTFDPFPNGLDRSNISDSRKLLAGRIAREDLRWYLVNKYRHLFIDKLTRDDLEELQHYHRLQYDPKRGWNHENLRKFVLKLQEYMHDEILKREIVGIETVVLLMKPDDVGKHTLSASSDIRAGLSASRDERRACSDRH